jgi:hypothetical protein
MANEETMVSVTLDLMASMFTPRKGDIFWTPSLVPFTEPLQMEYHGSKVEQELVRQHRAHKSYMEAYSQQVGLQKLISEALS